VDSFDAVLVKEEDGNTSPFIESVEDENARTPEDTLARKQLNAAVVGTLMSLPTVERKSVRRYETWPESAGI